MKRLAIAILALSLALGTSVFAQTSLSVHFIDVGQGDAILIDYGKYEMLIDGGSGQACSLYLRSAGCIDGALDVVVATHMDADHIGGLDEVLAQCQVDSVWTNGNSNTTAAYYAFQSAYIAEGCRLKVARRDDTIELGSLSMKVIHPSYLTSDRNNDSVVLLLSFKGWNFLFTGDIGQSVESILGALNLLPDIDVLKVAHHGSRGSTSDQFLATTTPQISIISVGASNSYGHPSPETLKRIGCVVPGSLILRTDIHGTVIISVDSSGSAYYSIATHFPAIVAVCDKPPPPPGDSAPCNCSGPDLNCSNFTTHAVAQRCYDYCKSKGYGDVFRLDADKDGIACESLP